MKYSIVIATLTAAIGFASYAHAAEFVEGTDYRVLAKPDVIKSDVIIVREFFYYGCSHCYNMEPALQKWEETKANDVAFFQSPAAINPKWEVSARGFYASQLMGYQHATHNKLYEDVFKNSNKAIISTDTQALVNWYTQQGLDQKTFQNNLTSYAVETRINRNKQAASRYKLMGTPTIVVHGKYVINSAAPEKTIKVLDFLVNKVRDEK